MLSRFPVVRAGRTAILALTAALALPAAAQAVPQTWVSGVGDDANPCSRTAPCKTFAGAISKTDAGGVISVLDPGGFGAVTITKAITIDANGVFAGVLVAGTNGIVVQAPAGSDVVLRGLTLDFIPPCTAPGSLHGIRFLSGRSLHVEDVRVRGFPGAAIDAEPTADGSSVTVRNSELRDNCTAGFLARRTAGHVDATLADSFLSHDGTGVLAGAGSQVSITNNTIVANSTGLANETGGVLASFGDNRVAGNVVDGAPTVELNAPPPAPAPPPPAPPAGNPNPPPPPPPAPAVTCRVPNVTGLTITQTRSALAKAHCGLGRIRLVPKRGKKRNRVYAQSKKAGSTLAAGAAIDVTVNKRPPKKARKKRKAKARAALGGASRTWVSGVGDDANPCSRTAPCKTFAGAINKTADGGLIDVLDPGDFGPVTISQSVTIDGAGNSASIVASAGGTAVTITAPAGKDVILRGLTLINSPGCSTPGAGDGVRLTSGGVLHLENVTARGFAGAGVALQPSLDEAVTIHGGSITDNCTAGISAARSGGKVDVTVDHATPNNDNTGVLAGDGSLVRLTENTITGNATGIATAGNGVVQGWGDNHVTGNTANGVTPGLLKLV